MGRDKPDRCRATHEELDALPTSGYVVSPHRPNPLKMFIRAPQEEPFDISDPSVTMPVLPVTTMTNTGPP